MTRKKDSTLTEVPMRASHVREIRKLVTWIEPSVWTVPMLTALVIGVKGGKWYSLMDKVYKMANLRSAFKKVKANKGSAGVDHQTIEMFEKHLEKNIKKLHRDLKKGRYKPQRILRQNIPKAGKRKETLPLGIPTVRDRVVQTALRNVLEPIFEMEFAAYSYGFRPNRGCKGALRRVSKLLETGYTWVVDVDLKSYFDTIPHEKLIQHIKEKIVDTKVLALLETFLKQEILEEMHSWTPERGTPQGAVVSPLLSNIYLNPLDHLMAALGYEMVRYADDLVILCKSKAACQQAMMELTKWTSQAGLTLHPEKTKIVDSKVEGFDFLGYHFKNKKRWPSKKSMKRLRSKISPKTKRTNGTSMKTIIKEVNKTTIGWYEYFKHSNRITFVSVDGWIRMRLRSILRKRSKRKGRGRGKDHQRWPNSYFGALGLFSLTAARDLACQSARR
ncbi:group II intron reverse transcriptase/maturase [candidate division CSSED10-310 bacterium]|uniref:Group II intron reverse transcriptase/maturase n=1 Tax=candidate division CSSED10-310 bacterium TaxID=2855610 RepID=A0ABV6YS62_UNCC1